MEIKRVYSFTKEERSHNIPNAKRIFFLSSFERNFFLLVVAFSSDKGTHMSSAGQTWIITWKIVHDRSWSNKIVGDRLWSNKIGGGGSWIGSLNYFYKKTKVQFLDHVNSICCMRTAVQIFPLENIFKPTILIWEIRVKNSLYLLLLLFLL